MKLEKSRSRKMRQILSFLLASALCSPTTEAYSQSSIPPRLHTDSGRMFVHLVGRSYDVLLVNPAQAIEQLNLALKKDRSWEAYAVRAAAQERLGNYEDAIADYSRALESRLYDLNVIRTIYQARGRAYADVGKHELAIKDFTEIVDNVMQIHGYYEEASPDEQTLVVNAYLGRGQSYEALLQYRQAMKDYEQAIQLSPNNDTANRFRANLHSKLSERQLLFEEEK
jgi:tetratricopeptide (TPR) repeat protein